MNTLGFFLILLSGAMQTYFVHKANKRVRLGLAHQRRLTQVVTVKTPYGDELPEGSDDYRAGWQACLDHVLREQLAEIKKQRDEL